MIQILNENGIFLYSIKSVMSCSVCDSLNGEFTLNLSVPTSMAPEMLIGHLVLWEGQYFHIVQLKKNIQKKLHISAVSCEHISYVLNNEEYQIAEFEFKGSPTDGLAELLKGTPFSVGVVEFTDELKIRINQKTTRRKAVMQLIAILGGEIEYDGYAINIRVHRGNTERRNLMDSEHITDLSVSYDSREGTASYDLSLYKKSDISVGDEVKIRYKPLGIEVGTRIIEIQYNPYNSRTVKITVGSYKPTIDDTLYKMVEKENDNKSSIEDLTSLTAKFTIEFGELIGNGTFFFTRQYKDKPYFHIHTNDGSVGTVTLNTTGTDKDALFVGATLSGVNSNTTTLIVFYCTLPEEGNS